MTGFIIRRLGQAIVVVLGVTLITFILLHLLPGSLARDILGNRATPQAIAQFNQQNHLNDSFFVQYWYFLDQLLHGNLGYSYQFNRSVDSLLAVDLPRDLVLGGLSLIFSLVIAIPTGIAQAVKRNSAVDYAGTGISFLLYSMPQYAIALLLIQFLSISFHVFPAEAPDFSLLSAAQTINLAVSHILDDDPVSTLQPLLAEAKSIDLLRANPQDSRSPLGPPF